MHNDRFASVDSLEKNISGSINSLGNDVIYVQKWPGILEGTHGGNT